MAGSGRPGRFTKGGAAAAVVGAGFGRAHDWRLGIERVPEFLRACVAQEIEERRLFPWIAVAFGLGILLFFAADGAPRLWAPLAGCLGATAAAVALRDTLWPFAAAVAAAAVFGGFTAGVVRTIGVDAPVLQRTAIGAASGFIESIDEREKG